MVFLSQILQHHITAEWLEGTGSCWCSEGDNCWCSRSKCSLKFYFQGRQHLHFWIGLKKLQLHTIIKLMIPSRERDGFHFTYYTLKMLPPLQSLSCCNRSVNTQTSHPQLQAKKEPSKNSLTADASYTGWSAFRQEKLAKCCSQTCCHNQFWQSLSFSAPWAHPGAGSQRGFGISTRSGRKSCAGHCGTSPCCPAVVGGKNGEEIKLEGLGRHRINCNYK